MKSNSIIEKLNQMMNERNLTPEAIKSFEEEALLANDSELLNEIQSTASIDTLLKNDGNSLSASALKDSLLEKLAIDDASIRNQRIRTTIKWASVAILIIVSVISISILNNNSNDSSIVSSDPICEKSESTNQAKQGVNTDSGENISYTENIEIEESELFTNQTIASDVNGSTNANNTLANKIDEDNDINDDNVRKSKSALDNNDDLESYIEPMTNSLRTVEYSSDWAGKVNNEVNISRANQSPAASFEPVYIYNISSMLENFNIGVNWYGVNYNYPINSVYTSSALKDFSINLMYNLNANHSIGVAAGSDVFALKFSAWEGDVQSEYTSSKFEILWFGANYQYQFDPIFGIGSYVEAYPYAQIGAAYATIGMYSQLNVGLGLSIANKTDILFGISSGALLYQADEWNLSGKAGINIGVQLGL